jgi:uncharacterized protein YybS (DUF2232 family)
VLVVLPLLDLLVLVVVKHRLVAGCSDPVLVVVLLPELVVALKHRLAVGQQDQMVEVLVVVLKHLPLAERHH